MATDIQTLAPLPDLVLAEIDKRIETLGSQKAVADELGTSESLITEIKKGRRSAPLSVVAKLGFMRITFHVRATHAPRVVRVLEAALSEDAHLQKLLDKVLSK